MKNIFQKSGAQLRARTRALCALTLALLCITQTANAQIWGTEKSQALTTTQVSNASLNVTVTPDDPVNPTKKYVVIEAEQSGSPSRKVWVTLIVDASVSVTDVDDIPAGTYYINDSELPGTALASKGLNANSFDAHIIGTGTKAYDSESDFWWYHSKEKEGTQDAYVVVGDDYTGTDHNVLYMLCGSFHDATQTTYNSINLFVCNSGNIRDYEYAKTITACGSGTATKGGDANRVGKKVWLTATPTAPATFVEWRDGDGNFISSDNEYYTLGWGPDEFVAVFSDGVGCASAAPATPTYDVTATVSPAGAGTVTGSGTYDEGDDVSLSATPTNRRYQFVRWTESASEVGTTASYSIDDIDADHAHVAVFEEIPVTIADNENSTYYSTTLSTFSTETDFQLMRTFYAGMWNTVCFPFDLTAAQRTNSDMSGATFYTLTSVTGDASTGLDFNVTEVTGTMTARTPYLVQFTGSNIVNPVFEDVTLAANAFTNNSGTDIGQNFTFFGTLCPTALEQGQANGYLFLGQDNALYWPNTANPIRAFRAYFYSGNNAVQAIHPRVRIVVRGETPTDVEERIADGNGSAPRKYLHNGVLVIEKNGIRYNAVGQPLSE